MIRSDPAGWGRVLATRDGTDGAALLVRHGWRGFEGTDDVAWMVRDERRRSDSLRSTARTTPQRITPG